MRPRLDGLTKDLAEAQAMDKRAEAFAFAEESPFPTVEELSRDLFAEPAR